MKFLSVKNLRKYQHYRDRKPPWIKLHSSVLDDYAFACLPDASKAHAMLIWVLASQHDNKLPADAKWIGGKIAATDPVDIDALEAAGFLVEWQHDAECEQDASDALAGEPDSAMPRGERGEDRGENPPPSPSARTTNRQAFLDALPDAKARQRWDAQIAGWLDGLGLAQAATDADVETGLGDYLLAGHRDFSPKHVRGFIRNAIHARLNPPKTTGPPTTNGASRSRKLTTAERVFIRASGGHA